MRSTSAMLLFCLVQGMPLVAYATCSTLLEAIIPGQARAERVALTGCEVTAEFTQLEGQSNNASDKDRLRSERASESGVLALKLTPAAARRWRDALGSSPYQGALEAGELRIVSNSAGLVDGPIRSIRPALGISEKTWRWDEQAGQLLWHPPIPASPVDMQTGCGVPGPDLFVRLTYAAPGEVIMPPPLQGAYGRRVTVPAYCIKDWVLTDRTMANVHLHSGIVAINGDAKDGAGFEVRFQVGRQVVKWPVQIVDPAKHPLMGQWTQTEQKTCGATSSTLPGDPIKVLDFRPDGTFSVSWELIETYRDYWGSFAFDRKQGKIRVEVKDGNYIPSDIANAGELKLVGNDKLVLRNMSFGTKGHARGKICEMTFTRIPSD